MKQMIFFEKLVDSSEEDCEIEIDMEIYEESICLTKEEKSDGQSHFFLKTDNESDESEEEERKQIKSTAQKDLEVIEESEMVFKAALEKRKWQEIKELLVVMTKISKRLSSYEMEDLFLSSLSSFKTELDNQTVPSSEKKTTIFLKNKIRDLYNPVEESVKRRKSFAEKKVDKTEKEFIAKENDFIEQIEKILSLKDLTAEDKAEKLRKIECVSEEQETKILLCETACKVDAIPKMMAGQGRVNEIKKMLCSLHKAIDFVDTRETELSGQLFFCYQKLSSLIQKILSSVSQSIEQLYVCELEFLFYLLHQRMRDISVREKNEERIFSSCLKQIEFLHVLKQDKIEEMNRKAEKDLEERADAFELVDSLFLNIQKRQSVIQTSLFYSFFLFNNGEYQSGCVCFSAVDDSVSCKSELKTLYSKTIIQAGLCAFKLGLFQEAYGWLSKESLDSTFKSKKTECVLLILEIITQNNIQIEETIKKSFLDSWKKEALLNFSFYISEGRTTDAINMLFDIKEVVEIEPKKDALIEEVKRQALCVFLRSKQDNISSLKIKTLQDAFELNRENTIAAISFLTEREQIKAEIKQAELLSFDFSDEFLISTQRN